MFESEIPFELHITTSPLLVKEMDDFVSFCITHEAKPLLIELARGEYIDQPMMNKVILVHSLDEALLIASGLTEQLNANNWKVQRLKIEIPAYYAGQWNASEQAFAPYFEWHGKIKGDPTPELLGFCQQHRAHLSLNALKKEDNYRFITLREFESKAVFQERVDHISGSLTAAGWPLIKEVSEFCVYDNNVYLDKGWLPI
jgi:hypothetical protein